MYKGEDSWIKEDGWWLGWQYHLLATSKTITIIEPIDHMDFKYHRSITVPLLYTIKLGLITQ